MRIFNTLYAKLAATFLVLVTILGCASLLISQSMSETYSQEIMQRLNQSVAMYITDRELLIDQGSVNEAAVDEITNRAMILNPSLELYVLDPQGKILSHRLPQESVRLNTVAQEPINTYLNNTGTWPILGEDPRNPENLNVFSVSPIIQSGQLQGYIYAIVGGQMYQGLRDSVMDSYAIQVGILLMVGSILTAGFVGCLVFFFLTRRLKKLRTAVHQFNPAESLENNQLLSSKASAKDEIYELHNAFHSMGLQIHQQFEELKTLDSTRRELIANTSHDLRTPLASMQGYIETLLIKNETLNQEERKDYLKIAFKHCKRLGRLISELFELSKLESNGIKPKIEPFSLLELAHDCVQEFSFASQKQQINLTIEANESDCFVVADIALIHRVLQNLVENALRHTPQGGSIQIKISDNDDNATIEVSDTGRGIKTHEIPYIFERYYQSHQLQRADKIGTGLGLAIVKRILDLHQSRINVTSQLDKGTSFIFELPQYHTSAA